MSQTETHTRRDFLQRYGRWSSRLLGILVLLPVIRFVSFRIPAKPRKILVNKKILLGGFHVDPEFFLFLTEEKVWAVSRTCTHLGCQLAINEQQKKLICPCHQSQFSYEGKRLAGPAQKDLPLFPVERSEGKNDRFTVIL